MKAVTYSSYGGPEVLEYTGIPDPKVGPDAILVRVKASSVNPVDWKIRQGHLDAVMDVFFPAIPGWDVAGVVEAVGPAVFEFAPGDEVMGYVREDVVHHGAFAERIAAPYRTLSRRPKNATWEQAGSLPLAGLTAYQSLTRALKIGEGDTVLIHAASGGVGSLAVQIAVAKGARVIGTSSERNHDFLRSLGADPVRYGDGLVKRVRELAPDGVSAVLDLVGGEALETTPDLLTEEGRVASIIEPQRVKELGGHYVYCRPEPTDLEALAGLVEAGKLEVEIATTYPLAEAAEAHRSSERGHTRGKIAVRVDPAD
jgi:NADPH:quinone reductase-like Zn-dependent oxidoreductase